MSPIDEAEVREVAGVCGTWTEARYRTGFVRLIEGEEKVGVITPSSADYPTLNPNEARHLARQLYRLARRIDERDS